MLSSDLINLKEKILILVCCGPCSAGVIEFISKNNINMDVFFYNPNIYPEEEYLKRKDEVIKLCKLYNIKFIDTDYTPDEWVKSTIGMGDYKERGKRCEACFKLRLLKSAIFARDNGYKYFTSTLGFSRYKDLDQVNKAGFDIEEFSSVSYLDINFRKEGIQEQTNNIIKENNIYHQDYCGCIYSLKNKS